MFRIFGDRIHQRLVLPDTDAVITAFPLPAGSILNQVWMDIHIIGGETPINSMGMFGVTGYILPILDPDQTPVLNDVWDFQVPKSDDMLTGAGTDSLDTDTFTALVTTPDVEPGQLDLNFIEVGNVVKKVISRREWISFASSPTGFEGGAENIYRPTARFKINMRKRYKVHGASYVMVAVSSPDLTETVATPPTVIGEKNWVQLQFMQYTLKQAWTQMVGLTETGGETPWVDALQLVEKILQPELIEETTGRFTQQSWDAYCISTFDVSVPGDMDQVALGGR